uniref:Sushi domain-containing protein n=1 Tax=Bubo bubo TaxID=30461 RepID=A0A8C0EWB1_BUBBB
ECKILLYLLWNCTLWLFSLSLGSCPSPPRVRFAKISQEDETQSFYPVGITVRYICRPGYENTTDQLPTSTCLDNLTWSAVPELCQSECLHLVSFSPASSHSCIRSAVL